MAVTAPGKGAQDKPQRQGLHPGQIVIRTEPAAGFLIVVDDLVDALHARGIVAEDAGDEAFSLASGGLGTGRAATAATRCRAAKTEQQQTIDFRHEGTLWARRQDQQRCARGGDPCAFCIDYPSPAGYNADGSGVVL